MSYQHLTNCLACGGHDLRLYLDLGCQPLANSFHKLGEHLDEFPLQVKFCAHCFHSQLSVAVDPDKLFKNYLYVSGTTDTLRGHFSEFVRYCERDFSGNSLDVLDIASNDGSLLREFKARGHRVLGVDPAENIRSHSIANGIETIVDYWSQSLADSLPKFDAIVAMNVLAHVSSPLTFLTACASALKPGGRVYVQTSQADMLRNFEFDTIYHEHHSFFSAQSFAALALRAGLKIQRMQKVAIHGTSYLLTLGREDHDDQSLDHMISQEKECGLYEFAHYEKFSKDAADRAASVRQLMGDYSANGYRLFGYGAAAKGNTFLNYSKLTMLEALVDDNPLKVGLYAPGTRIPVRATEHLKSVQEPVLILILAWNFFDEICNRLSRVRSNELDRVFSYFGHSTKPRALNSLSSAGPTR